MQIAIVAGFLVAACTRHLPKMDFLPVFTFGRYLAKTAVWRHALISSYNDFMIGAFDGFTVSRVME